MMKMTIESTEDLTRVEGVPCRVWKGTTEGGTPCIVFVHRVAVRDDKDCSQFEKELQEQVAPGRYVPLSMIL